jgi:hypothetical protein
VTKRSRAGGAICSGGLVGTGAVGSECEAICGGIAGTAAGSRQPAMQGGLPIPAALPAQLFRGQTGHRLPAARRSSLGASQCVDVWKAASLSAISAHAAFLQSSSNLLRIWMIGPAEVRIKST